MFTFVQPPRSMSGAVHGRLVRYVTGPGFAPDGVGRRWDHAAAPSAEADGGMTWL